MSYSHASPSPRYRELLELYRQMHVEGERARGRPPEETFSGESLGRQIARIKRLVAKTSATSILDYGSGKGRLYDLRNRKLPDGTEVASIADYWDVDYVYCYDPAYAPFSERPKQRFDGVVCTDVLEHCPEEDLGWIIEDLFGFAARFVFASIACFPAAKHLPNGENAHTTLREPEWWRGLFAAAVAKHPGIEWEVWTASREDEPEGRFRYSELRIGPPE